MPQTPENQVYLFRLQMLIIDGGLLVFRNLIDQTLTVQGITLSACLNQESAKINHLKKRRIITQEQYDILFPTGGQVPNTSQMDITLIIFLLRCLTCFGLNTNFDWTAKPLITDTSIEADICRLKAYRNEISHLTQTTDIDVNRYGTLWNDIEQMLVRRSSPSVNIQQTIADFKACPLDPEEEKRVQEEIMKWKDYEAEIDRLKDEMKDVIEFVKAQEEINRQHDEQMELMKTQITELQTLLSKTLSKKVVTTVKASVMLRALEQKTAEELENVLLKVSTESLTHLESSEPNKAVRNMVDNLVQDMNDKGFKVEDVSEGSIVYTIKCQSVEDLIDLIDYFDSPMFKKHLEAISRALTEVTGKKIEIHSMILTGPLSEELRRHEYEMRHSTRNLKLPVLPENREETSPVKMPGLKSAQATSSHMAPLSIRESVHHGSGQPPVATTDMFAIEQGKYKLGVSYEQTEENYQQQKKRKYKLGVSYEQTEENYQQQKKKLQGDLIKFYRKRCSSIPLSPLLEEIETPLAGFYVMPDLVAVKQKTLTCHEEERTPIKSLKDLFSTGSADHQEIYLSADAGFGKTAFSKYLAITWCQAHCHDENYPCFKDDELKTLFDFKFLFLVLLRDCSSVCNIDDMIKQQITTKLRPSASLNEVLGREKCLIILDGLDEWTHPDNSCGEVTEKIPHRYVPDNCVILTTTRPWKLGVSNLKTSQINKKVELVHLSAESTRQLEENAIRKMTGVHNDRVLKSKRWDFNKVISDRRLQHMQVIPLLLMYIVCLWCNNIPMGNSKQEIYTNIIEFLLSRTSKKHPEVQPSRESSAIEIPEYFKRHEFCKMFYSLITSLAELAYQTLFNENRENTLVFDRTVAEKYLKADDMKISLLSGILSESRSKTLIKEFIKVSFSHKTVQEFFAAIFISSKSDAQKIVVEKCRNVQDILDMSKVCEFISKMNPDLMCAISNDLMYVINEDETTRDYRTRTGREGLYNNPLYKIQEMFTSCLQEMPESENIQLCLQDFFIDDDTKNSEQLQRLLKQNKTNIKSLYIYIRHTSSSNREIIDLFSLRDLSHIQKLFYCGNWMEAEINRILFPSLQAVSLLYDKWTNDEENLNENMARCQNLQYLYITNFTLSHKILETFFNFISSQKSMKRLSLRYLCCKEHGDHDCKRWILDLSQHSTLSELGLSHLPRRLQLNITTPSLVNVGLWGINLDESSLLLSRDMLNIQSVNFEEIEMSAGSLHNFISVLENLPQSVTVKMRYIKPKTEYERFRENIRISQTFHVIREEGEDKWQPFEFKKI